MAIEETGQFKGLYQVLGGVISPIEGIGPSDLNIDALIERVKNEAIEEIIMAISPTIEGDTTIYYVSKKLAALNVKVSTIARGVSFGGELEYADELTLGRSIVSRIPLHPTLLMIFTLDIFSPSSMRSCFCSSDMSPTSESDSPSIPFSTSILLF